MGMTNNDDAAAPLSKVLGLMAWTHPSGSRMLITFRRGFYKNDSKPYSVSREFIGTDGVLRRGGTAWRDVEDARAEWAAMCERYRAKGWTRVAAPESGDAWDVR